MPAVHPLLCTNSYSSGAPAARRHVEAGHLVPTLDSLLYQTGSSLVGLRTYCWGMDGGASLDRVLHGVTDVVILAGPIDDPIVSLQRGGAEAVHRPIGRVRPTNVGFILSYSDSAQSPTTRCARILSRQFALALRESKVPILLLLLRGRFGYHAAVLCSATALNCRRVCGSISRRTSSRASSFKTGRSSAAVNTLCYVVKCDGGGFLVCQIR